MPFSVHGCCSTVIETGETKHKKYECFTFAALAFSPDCIHLGGKISDVSLESLSPGFSHHVPAPRGNNLPHHLFLREQHGTSGNTSHVSPRCS